MVFLLWVSSSPGFALDSINISYPSPAPFYIPLTVALHQGFFRDQNLDVKLIVTRAEVERSALVSGDIDFTRRIGSTILSAARRLPVRTAISIGSNRFGCKTIFKLFAAEPSNVVS